MIVKVVQPNLTPRNDLGVPRQLLKFLKVDVRSEFGFVRVDPDRGQDKFVALSQLNAAVQRAGTRSTANGDDLFNAAVPRPRDHEFAVGVELLHFEMSVGIYKHSRWSFVIGRWSRGICNGHVGTGRSLPWAKSKRPVKAERSSAAFTFRSISAWPPKAHPPRRMPGSVCRPRVTPRRSFRSIRVRAASAEQGSRRSRPVGPQAFQ